MRRAPLRSICLLLAAASCTEDALPVRPPITLGDAALTLMDVGDPVDDRPATPDAGAATPDVRTGADSGAVTGDTGAVTGDTGAVTGDTGAVTGDTGAVTGDTGAVTGDTGPRDAGVADSGAADSGAADAGGGACAAGLSACGPDGGALACVDVRMNTSHCGACGRPCCGTSDRCVANVCSSRCPTLMVSCPTTAAVDAGCIATRCVDVDVDDLNCGACGHACPAGKGCVSGRCL